MDAVIMNWDDTNDSKDIDCVKPISKVDIIFLICFVLFVVPENKFIKSLVGVEIDYLKKNLVNTSKRKISTFNKYSRLAIVTFALTYTWTRNTMESLEVTAIVLSILFVLNLNLRWRKILK